MPGRRSRDKGARRERELARLLGGQRVPLSGAAGGEFSEDVVVPGLGRVQVKARRDGWRTLYAALAGGADALALRADRRPWLVVMPVETVLRLLGRTTANGDGAHPSGDAARRPS